MKSTYPLVPVANFLAFFMMLLVVLTSRLRLSCNLGICAFSTWTACLALLTAIQTIVWKDSADTNIAPVFCDISIHVQVGMVAAGPACTFIIARCLYSIIRNPAVSSEDVGKHRHDLLVNLFLVLGLPMIMNALYYVVQNSRFQVWEQYGCIFSWQSSGLSIIMLSIIPMPLFMASAVYIACAIVALWKHKRNMSHVFVSQRAVTRSIYLRLFAWLFLICNSGGFICNLFPLPSQFYTGWSAVHDHWTPVAVSAAEWQAQGTASQLTVVWNDWINVWLAAVTFGLFGFTQDARNMYQHALRILLGWAGRLRASPSQPALPLKQRKKPARTPEFGHVSSLNGTLAVASPTDEFAASTNVIAIEIAVAVEKCTDGDTESKMGSEYERNKGLVI